MEAAVTSLDVCVSVCVCLSVCLCVYVCVCTHVYGHEANVRTFSMDNKLC